MSTKDYREKWKQINQKGIPLDSSHSMRGFEPFWEDLERAVNKTLREMLVQGTDDDVLNVTIDDDKIHYNTKEGKAGVLLVKHTRDNRSGYVVSPA